MRRGDVYDARLDPVEGSEQAGTRPVIVVSRDAINTNLSIVVVVPCTTHRPSTRLHPSRVLVPAPDGGLSVDSVALCEQIRTVTKARLQRHRGTVSHQSLAMIDRALRITLDL
jgi:mRNA interferase MazF